MCRHRKNPANRRPRRRPMNHRRCYRRRWNPHPNRRSCHPCWAKAVPLKASPRRATKRRWSGPGCRTNRRHFDRHSGHHRTRHLLGHRHRRSHLRLANHHPGRRHLVSRRPVSRRLANRHLGYRRSYHRNCRRTNHLNRRCCRRRKKKTAIPPSRLWNRSSRQSFRNCHPNCWNYRRSCSMNRRSSPTNRTSRPTNSTMKKRKRRKIADWRNRPSGTPTPIRPPRSGSRSAAVAGEMTSAMKEGALKRCAPTCQITASGLFDSACPLLPSPAHRTTCECAENCATHQLNAR